MESTDIVFLTKQSCILLIAQKISTCHSRQNWLPIVCNSVHFNLTGSFQNKEKLFKASRQVII